MVFLNVFQKNISGVNLLLSMITIQKSNNPSSMMTDVLLLFGNTLMKLLPTHNVIKLVPLHDKSLSKEMLLSLMIFSPRLEIIL